MNWLRLWHDMPNDPKWRTIARRSGKSISDVLAIYLHMMVVASENDPRGTIKGWDDEDVGAALDMDAEVVKCIREAMQGKVINGESLTGWEKRQPSREDDSRERVRKHREKKAQESKQCNEEGNAESAKETGSNADVTPSNAPEESREEENREEEKEQPCATEAAPDISAEVLDYLNAKAHRNFRNAPTNTKLILARAKEGATLDDFKAVIDRKCKEWAGNPGMAQYLRPATLFNAEKFNQYIGQLGAPMPTSNLLDGTSRFSSRHTGFDNRDYSEGLIQGVSDDAANF